MIIRPLVAADRPAWEPLWRGYLEFYKADVAAIPSDLTFARLTGGEEPMGGFIATVEYGAALGIVHWIVHRSCWTAGDYCYLQELFVAPAARKSGVGRKLIEHVYALAAREGCARVYWLTHETNSVAIELYDRIANRTGFIQYRKDL